MFLQMEIIGKSIEKKSKKLICVFLQSGCEISTASLSVPYLKMFLGGATFYLRHFFLVMLFFKMEQLEWLPNCACAHY